MIVTVTPNAAVDRTVQVGRLEPGRRVQARSERAQAGGKGVNVARVLRALGLPVTAVVLVGGEAGRFIVEDLAGAGIPTAAVEARGESRTCLELIEDDGTVTQVHGPGVAAGAAEADALVAACARVLPGARWLAISGSLAPGLPEDTVARIVACAAASGVRTAVDGHGPALPRAVAEGPDLLRVNRDEWAGAWRGDPEAARALPTRSGAVSDGDGPVFAWASEVRYRVKPPPVTARSPVGCGDAMLAGMLARLSADEPFAAALRFGVALGAADAESPCAGRPDPGRARALVAGIRPERLA